MNSTECENRRYYDYRVGYSRFRRPMNSEGDAFRCIITFSFLRCQGDRPGGGEFPARRQ